jgi:AcrR family transcriptional regulator
MSRLTRAELQLRNRERVLVAARDEFAERGFRDAKIDSIAERADLTRGAVYSNFAGKRALYFAALADLASQPSTISVTPGRTTSEALGAFAEAWLNRYQDSGPAYRTDRLLDSDQRLRSSDRTGGAPQRANATSLGAGAAQHGAGATPHGAGSTPLGSTATPQRASATSLRSGAAPLGTQLLPEVMADDDTRWQYGQLLGLGALLLGLSLEHLGFADEHGRRMVGVAEIALTTLRGAGDLLGAAPGFVQPLQVVKACHQLADLELIDRWEPPPTTPPVRPADEAWDPPAAEDAVRAGPARLTDDGLVVILGMNRLAAAEDVVRAAVASAVQTAGPGLTVTVALVSDRPAELAPLGRAALAEVCGCLRQAFLEPDWPGLQIVHDESGELAAAAGVEAIGNGLEFAVRIIGGRIVSRAEGFGATHAVASADISPTVVRLAGPR